MKIKKLPNPELLKSFPKDYFVEGGEDMIESFLMIDK